MSVTCSGDFLLAHFDGGRGVDGLLLDASPFTGDVSVSLDRHGALSASATIGTLDVTATHVENLVVSSGSGADSLTGGAGADMLDGGDNADVLSGGDGNDILCGGDRNHGSDDTIIGGAGVDLYQVLNLNASALQDYSAFDASGGDVVVTDELGGHDHLSGIEGVFLTAFDEVGGSCTLIGSAGDDQLNGSNAGDVLTGGAGDDTFLGGAGGDTLKGGAGADTFAFGFGTDSTVDAPDLILGLQDVDVIDLSGLDADQTNSVKNDAFTLVAHFTGHAGEASLSYDAQSGLTSLELDLNGDAQADMVVTIKGDHTDFTNFVL